MSKSRNTWIGGAVFLSIVLMALGWFVVISPKLDQASNARAETDNVEQQNVELAKKVAKLKADFVKLDDYRATLGDLEIGIPTEERLVELLEAVESHAADNDVVVKTLGVGVPVIVTAPDLSSRPVAVPVEKPSASEGSGEDAESGTSDDASPTDEPTTITGDVATPKPVEGGSAVLPGYTQVAVNVSVVGSYENTAKFIEALQTKMVRLLLVTGVTVTSLAEGPETDGLPAIQEGDIETMVTSNAYVLTSNVPPVEAETPQEPGPMPSGSDSRFRPNPDS